MDEWENVLKGYQETSDPKLFLKVLKSAEIVIANDLAPFEAEWILSTLFEEPVNLFHVVSDNRTSDDWSKCIINSLKLISDIVQKYDCAKYYEDIVSLCLLPLEAGAARQQALGCLRLAAARSALAARGLAQHLAALEMATTCKAPLALLIGAICEHHPEIVESEMTTIWRTFLNFLDFNKNSETVIRSALEGVMGLLKHFAMELPTMELNVFYEKLIKYLDLPKCEKTVLLVLRRHAALFRERLLAAPRVRARAWHAVGGASGGGASGGVAEGGAAREIYAAVACVASESELQNIIRTEIEPRTRSSRYQERFTALYVLSDLHRSRGLGDMNEYMDVQKLEFDIRGGNVDYETCEAISWCVQTDVLFSDRLLQAAILFYDRFVSLKRGDVIVHALLQAKGEVRSAAIIFLVSESCRSPSQQYAQLWDDLLNTGGGDPIVSEHAPAVVDEVLEYMCGVLEGHEGDTAACASLLLRVQAACPRAHAPLLRALRRVRGAGAAHIACALAARVAYENISIEQIADDGDRYLCSLALATSDDDDQQPASEVVVALEVLFSRKDTKAAVLSRAIGKLERLLQKGELKEVRLYAINQKPQVACYVCGEPGHVVNSCPSRVNNMKKDQLGAGSKGVNVCAKTARGILDCSGKYGQRDSKKDTNSDSYLVARLKNTLSLELPYQNVGLKINLKELCHWALEGEDVEACKTLIQIICSKLTTNKDAHLQSVLIRLLVCLSHGDVDISCILTAVSVCDAVHANELIRHIERENSHRSRMMLLGALEVLLLSDSSDLLLQNILERMLHQDSTNNEAVQDIMEKLIQLLKDNNLLCQKFLPEVLLKVLKSGNSKLTNTVTDMFADKIELYENDVLNAATDNVLKVINASENKMADALIKMAVEFIRKIFELKNDFRCILNYYKDVCDEINLTVLVNIKRVYRSVFESVVLRGVFEKLFGCDDFDGDDGLFDFVAEYADQLVDFDREKTYKLLCRALEKLTPQRIIATNGSISKCLAALKETKNYDPMIEASLETNSKQFPIMEITESIEKYTFDPEHEVFLNALRVLVCSYDGPILMQHSVRIRQWLRWIWTLYESGFVERSLMGKMAYLQDLVGVSLKFYKDDELMDLFLKEENDSGVAFLKAFLPATFGRLARKPYGLLLSGLRRCCSLLNAVVRYGVRRSRGEEVLELVGQAWPTYAALSSFEQKHYLLLDLVVARPPATSPPVQWVLDTVGAGSLLEQTKLMALLPPGHDFDAVRALAARLPPLRALRGVTACALRALLDRAHVHAHADTHADTPAHALIDVVAALLEGDDSAGWWDDAIDMCMCSLARRADMRMLRHVYARSRSGRPRVCERLLLPFLRYTKPSLFEEFASSVLDEQLATLKMAPRAVGDHYSYEKCVADYVRALGVILIIFEKVPKENIESPRSLLYSKMSEAVGHTPHYLLGAVCKLCYTLRTRVACPEGAGASLVKICRSFHCLNYNCLATALLLRDPKPPVYATVFDASYWRELIADEPVHLPIRERWRQRVFREALPAALCELRTRTAAPARTRTHGAARTRTRMFTRTLSENPLAYDLPPEDEQLELQELEVADSPLNRHPCSGTLCALLSALGPRGPEHWREALERALRAGETPVRWLLAQAVVNSREALRPHASALQPALLALVSDTAIDGTLNGLHVDILDTLILWRESASEADDVRAVMECVVTTAVRRGASANAHWTLVDRLAKLAEAWKVPPAWASFEKYFADPKSDTARVCLQILKRITKLGILIPELSYVLMEAIEARRYMMEVYELFGLVLAIDDERELYVRRYSRVLEKLRKTDVAEYVRMLCHVQRGHPPACDDGHFRSIIDLTRKISSANEKAKCLEILAAHAQVLDEQTDSLSHAEALGDVAGVSLHSAEGLRLLRNSLHLLEGHRRRRLVLRVVQECGQLSDKLRPIAYEIQIEALKLLQPSTDTSEPPSKKRAGASNSVMLRERDAYTSAVLQGVARGLGDRSEGVRRSVREGVGSLLHEELDVRFCESFYFATLKQSDFEVSPAAILDVFFQGFRDEKFKNTKLRDEPLEVSEAVASNMAKLKVLLKQEESTVEGVDVTLSLDDLLASILEFSERNPDAAASLLVQIIKAISPKRPGFDFPSALGPLAVSSLGRRGAAAVARAAELWDCDGLKQAIEELLRATRGSEDEDTGRLLREDYQLRKLGPEQFLLGSLWKYDVDMGRASKKFSIQDLVSAFGKLSNWDNLTIQQRNSIKTGLPPLWTSGEDFKLQLGDYDLSAGPVWMKCMLSDGDAHVKCLSDADRWPRRLFDIAAVSEMSLLLESVRSGIEAETVGLRADIQPTDCLAQWAARIMIGSPRLPRHASRSRALAWCERASEMALHRQVLLCCKATVDADLYESETLKWFRQRVLARAALARDAGDTDELSSALDLALTYTPQFVESSSLEDVFGMNEAILTMRRDLKSLTKDHVQSAIQDIECKLKGKSDCIYNKKVLESICVTALTFYDQLWEKSTGTSDQNELLLSMSRALGLIADLALGPEELAADVMINRLDSFTGEELDEEVAQLLLDKLQLIVEHLDTIPLEHLKSMSKLFKKCDGHRTMRLLRAIDGASEYKMRLQLLGDAEHLLLHYCTVALRACDDRKEWTKAFQELKGNIFENPFAGPDYRVLEKYKTQLYGLADYDATDRQAKTLVLSSVASELRRRREDERECVSLSHACPSLGASETDDAALGRLLALRPGVHVYRFEEKIPIFVDSVRRPAVLRVRLSDGSARRYVVKRGERARAHCGAVRLRAAVCARAGYHVTQLSEDCVLIEFLEDHERFRSLMSSRYPLDEVAAMSRARGKDSELILSPSNSVRQFEAMCAKVPAYMLRSAVEEFCVSVQDFISKKRNFLEEICAMTLFSYLCGVGDRHLENLMLSVRDGRPCHVDCAAILQYGGAELPPARLTRNVLAMCDAQVLESRLQSSTQSLRSRSGLVLPSLSVTFKWAGDEDMRMEKLQYINSLIRGSSLSHLVTIEALSKSVQPYKEKYVQLMREVFEDFEEKDSYSVEEQVSSLLRQSTEPRILSVTRSAWEPWI